MGRHNHGLSSNWGLTKCDKNGTNRNPIVTALPFSSYSMQHQVQVLGFQHLDFVAAAVQSAGEPSTGLAFLDKYSIVVIGDLTRVSLFVAVVRSIATFRQGAG